MNTKSLLTRVAVPVLGFGLLGGAGTALATSASAATVPGAVHAVTHSPQHNDTTVGPVPVAAGSALHNSPSGPVWAVDNLTEQFTVVPVIGNPGYNYQVIIGVTGSFKGFADPGLDGNASDPGYGQPLTSSGPVKGTITYNVKSDNAPDPANLLPNQDPNTGLRAALGQLFGPGYSIVGSGSNYSFSYQNGNYVQDDIGTGIHGDVTGH
jgi:hypothetical protein